MTKALVLPSKEIQMQRREVPQRKLFRSQELPMIPMVSVSVWLLFWGEVLNRLSESFFFYVLPEFMTPCLGINRCRCVN